MTKTTTEQGENNLRSIRQLAEQLGISERSAWQLVHDRRLPHVQIGRLRRVRQIDIDAYITANVVDAFRPGKSAKIGA
jgi:excisionase family DNA binding protein